MLRAVRPCGELNHPGGYQIEVITSFLSYDGSRKLKRRETVRGVTVIRLPTSAFGRGKLLGRAIDYLTFYLAAFFVSGALTTPSRRSCARA